MVEEDNPTPGTTGLGATINISNASLGDTQAILFRVQTTSPLSYRVRPSHGRIPPGGSVAVHIALAVDSKKADKFLVKWVAVDASLEGDFNDMFTLGGKPEELRLRCVVPAVVPSAASTIPLGHVVTAPPGQPTSSTVAVSSTAPLSANASPTPSPVSSTEHSKLSDVAQTEDDNSVAVIKELRGRLSEALARAEELQRRVNILEVKPFFCHHHF